MVRRTAPRVLIYVILWFGMPGWCQDLASPASEVLTLDQAIDLALRGNRPVANAALEVEKSVDQIAASRTRRLPAFDVTAFGSQLLTPVDFLFREGAFGRFPGIGPIPAADTRISTPRQPNALVLASATQPLSQLHKIGLGVRLNQLNADIAREHLRLQKQSVVNDVKHTYYSLVQTQSALEAVEETLKLYRELERVVGEGLIQQVALKSDSLDVQARLANAEYQALVLRQAMATQKEQLNLLLGRDIRSGFTVNPVPEPAATEINLESAQAKALSRRPEILEARLKASQSEYDQRLKKSEFIPDVSLRLSYLSFFNYELLPKNVATLGFYATWEPFDWGRRKFELTQKVRTVQQAKSAVREAETQVLVEVNGRYRKLEESRALLRVAQLTRDTARERLRVATNRYKVQAVQLKDVLTEQTSLAAADRDYAQALAGFWTARADFEKAVGEDQ
ncbi:MAG: TolC family protein [Terriglobia bacterium]